MDTPSPGLRRAVEESFGLRLGAARAPRRGEESVGWPVHSDLGELFVQVLPAWRSSEEVRWVYSLAASVSPSVPEAVAPMRTSNGETLFEHDGRPVVVFPFVDGSVLDDEDEDLRAAVARVLARLHAATLRLLRTPRPVPYPSTPWARAAPEAAGLEDPELDRWHANLGERGLIRGVIHGDVYPRNVLCRNSRVVGVIDWYEAHEDFLAQELGWTMWEFAQTETGDDLRRDRAASFLGEYAAAGGPVPEHELGDLTNFIRWRLRDEILLARVQEAATYPSGYAAAELRAFERLRGTSISDP